MYTTYVLSLGNESDGWNVMVCDVYRLVPQRSAELPGPVVVPDTPKHLPNISFCMSDCKGNDYQHFEVNVEMRYCGNGVYGIVMACCLLNPECLASAYCSESPLTVDLTRSL